MEKKPTSGMAVTGLVLGIIALISSVVPLLNLLSFPFVLLAIIFGAIGVFQTVKGAKGGKGIAISGLVLGVLALIVTVAMYGGAAASADKPATTTGSSSTTAEQPATAPAEEGAASGAAAEGAQEDTAAADAQQTEATYVVTIDEAAMGTDYQGEKAAVITYTFTNNSDKACNFMTTIGAKAFQDGVQLEGAIGVDGVDSQDLMKDIKPGKSITVQQAYVLADTKNPVEVEVTELFDFSDELIAQKTFNLS
ncbi:DUF5067 domain-containing protein [Adlercreutzia equolifaciens]|uniref:DUF5067 domain-containing protein n=1 Tax=Adlercreutzia equolifaciens TaxID=446660 RepID=UPI0023B0A446|nr:DUF5067 domain-containing protein [Adlercreutzia equolifaciens]MDE8702620.1 DUF5067 domain-containing protein [Adlercreutzia equolifaciens]